MLQVPLNLSYIKSTLRPLYGWTQSTPKSQMIDPSWDKSVDIYPGMVMMKTVGDNVTLLNGTGVPYGLMGTWMAPTLGIDQISHSGLNACAVWVMGPDGEMEVLAPAFDSTASWVEPTDGTIAKVYAYTTGAKRGQLCPAGASGASTAPVARLVKVISTTKIVVGGLYGTA